jgi:calpain-15
VTRTELDKDLILYTTSYQVADKPVPLAFEYDVECAAYKSFLVTISIAGSENFVFEGKEPTDTELTQTAFPFKRVRLGKAIVVQNDRRVTITVNFDWRLSQPDDAQIRKSLESENANLAAQIVDTTSIFNFPKDTPRPNFQKITEICIRNRKKYVDFDFLPCSASIYKNNAAISQPNKAASAKSRPMDMACWRRASIFFQGPYEVFEKHLDSSASIEPGDIQQGILSNCWFMGAVASLAEFPSLVKDLFPKHSQSVNEYGVYEVALYQRGMLRHIIVDDYFPCFAEAGPLFSRSHGNELWVLLLEKAYAKAQGGYYCMKLGWSFEALIDLTGAPFEVILLEDPATVEAIESGDLFAKLEKYDQLNCLICASTPGEDVYTETGDRPPRDDDTGLVAGHAYSLLRTARTPDGQCLVQLRNPWGAFEWQGDWSDSSPLWTEELKVDENYINLFQYPHMKVSMAEYAISRHMTTVIFFAIFVGVD